MKLSATTVLAIVLICIGCSDSDEPLRGWKESDVEVVNEGAATGTTGQIVVGESATPMTATNIDTTTDLDMITDEQLGLAGDLEEGEEGQRSLADALEPESPDVEPTGVEPARGTTADTRPSPPVTREPDPKPASPQPAPTREPRRPEAPEQEPADTETAAEPDDSLPPIVTPPVEPEPPTEDERKPSPPPNDTASTDTTSTSERDGNPPEASRTGGASGERDERHRE